MTEPRSKSGDATTTRRGRTAHCSDRRRSSTQTAAEDWHNRWTERGAGHGTQLSAASLPAWRTSGDARTNSARVEADPAEVRIRVATVQPHRLQRPRREPTPSPDRGGPHLSPGAPGRERG